MDFAMRHSKFIVGLVLPTLCGAEGRLCPRDLSLTKRSLYSLSYNSRWILIAGAVPDPYYGTSYKPWSRRGVMLPYPIVGNDKFYY